jgi:hypothetical protein
VNNRRVARLENTFSWSISRHRTFQDCPRKYWFHYYGSWGGWEADAPSEARELYRLKNLTSLHLLAGDTVHRLIERVLSEWARGVEPEVEPSVEWCKRQMQRGWQESRTEAWRDSPKRFTRLTEHHYGPPPGREGLEKIGRKVGTSVRNFFSSQSWSLIRETDPRAWLPMETLDSFAFEGTKVFAVPDFACRHDDTLLLFDWKTGRRDNRNHDQVVLYALFAAAKWDADPERVQGAPVYLLDGGTFEPEAVSAEDRDRVGSLMRDSIRSMRSRLADAESNTARKEDFEASPGRACRWCNFRGVCPHAS